MFPFYVFKNQFDARLNQFIFGWYRPKILAPSGLNSFMKKYLNPTKLDSFITNKCR
jgi:hypothetical protein